MAGRLTTLPGGSVLEMSKAHGVERGVQSGTLALAGCLSMPLVYAAALGRRGIRHRVLLRGAENMQGGTWVLAGCLSMPLV